MRARSLIRTLSLATAMFLVLGVAQAIAATPPEDLPDFIDFGGDTKGALYFPDAAEYPDPDTAVLVIHRTGNFLAHTATEELPPRGFIVLGMNPHSDNNEAAVNWERIAADVKAGVEFLKDDVGVERFVLFGHSGGGPTTSYYQAIAEEGLSVLPGPRQDRRVP